MIQEHFNEFILITIGAVFAVIIPWVYWLCNSDYTEIQIFVKFWKYIVVGVAFIVLGSLSNK